MGKPTELVQLDKVADYLICDSDLWVTRRFEKLHVLNILAIQQRMYRLEKDLRDEVNDQLAQENGNQCQQPTKRSEELLERLQGTVKAYDDAILSLAAIKKTERPASHIVHGLLKKGSGILYSTLQALRPEYPESDTSHLISIATGSRSWFHQFIGSHHSTSRWFRVKKKHKNDPDHFSRYSEARVRNAEFIIVATFLCLVQLLPVLALKLVSNTKLRLAVIGFLIVLVSILNALFANTVRATNFGAIAAYSAIVVVFVSQSN